MSTEPAVSIVLPTFNGSRYLAQSIQSCLDQTWHDFELIIIDDCSTDETPRIIEQYACLDPRIRTVRNAVNRKLPGSINRGMSLARGKYLTWTSDDNLYRTDAIARMVSVLEQHDEVGLVYAHMDEIGDDGNLLSSRYESGPPETLAFRNPVGACFLYRRSVFEEVGHYAEDLFLVEDWDYWIRILKASEARELPEKLYLYRRHEGALSRQRREGVLRAKERLFERHLWDGSWSSNSARAHGFLSAARVAWRLRHYRKSLKLAAAGLKLDPQFCISKIIRKSTKVSTANSKQEPVAHLP